MFEGSLVESTPRIRQRSRWPLLISVGVQTACALALLSIPLLHPEVMSLRTPQMALFTPPPRPPQPPSTRQRVPVVSVEAAAILPNVAPAPAVAQIHRGGDAASTDSDAPPTTTSLNMTGSALPFSANPGTGTGHVVVRASETRAKPTAVSSGVTSGLLLAPIVPAYPTIAKASHIEGKVVIQAIISKSGAIESAHVLSGPALLQGAALDAVRRARYRPYLLNNEPTEVETTINIVFRMNG